jgi:streptomycin 6-kinase
MIVVPQEFAERTIGREGTAGREWIAALPDQVQALCAQWGLVVDGSPMHGGLSLVVPVCRGDEPCVLKIAWVSVETEAIALRAWDGRGAVRLLEVAPAQHAMLLERLSYHRSLNDVGLSEAVGIAGRLLRRLAIPAPAGLRQLPMVAGDLARDLPALWERTGRPLPRPVLDAVANLAGELAATRPAHLLVNFDLYYDDVLAGGREPWLVVDPMVVAGDPEYGIGPLLWRRLEDIEAQGGIERHFGALIAAAALDPALARAWTLVRCVEFWLWGLSAGLTYDPARCAIIVNRLL